MFQDMFAAEVLQQIARVASNVSSTTLTENCCLIDVGFLNFFLKAKELLKNRQEYSFQYKFSCVMLNNAAQHKSPLLKHVQRQWSKLCVHWIHTGAWKIHYKKNKYRYSVWTDIPPSTTGTSLEVPFTETYGT